MDTGGYLGLQAPGWALERPSKWGSAVAHVWSAQSRHWELLWAVQVTALRSIPDCISQCRSSGLGIYEITEAPIILRAFLLFGKRRLIGKWGLTFSMSKLYSEHHPLATWLWQSYHSEREVRRHCVLSCDQDRHVNREEVVFTEPASVSNN